MSRVISGNKQAIKSATACNRSQFFFVTTKRQFNNHAKCTVRVQTRFMSLSSVRMVTTASKAIKNDHFYP